jgi:cathepsin L
MALIQYKFDDFPYKSGTGRKVKCSLQGNVHNNDAPLFLRGAESSPLRKDGYIEDAVATIQGYVNFPTNNYTILMNAVADLGPIGVTVAASKWGFYSGGVFDEGNHNSTGATDVNHAVVLEGYGVDQETQEPYWLVRNSWGKTWGEGGYIRLKRVDPSSVPDWDETDCGVDVEPADGAGCTKDKDGKDIVPPPIKVCGTSAVLYDTFLPIGGRLLDNSNMPSVNAADQDVRTE